MKSLVAFAASLCLMVGIGCTSSETDDLIYETGGGKTDAVRPFGTFEQDLPSGREGFERLTLNEDRTYEVILQTSCDSCLQHLMGTYRFAASHGKQYVVIRHDDASFSFEYKLDGAKLQLREADSDDWFTMTRAAGAAALELDADDNGGKFDVKEGSQVVLRLPANPSTGYDWTITATDRSFGYGTKSFEASSNGPVGSGGTTKFVWETVSPLSLVGEHIVKLEYRRASGPADQTFEMTVNVVAP